MRRHVILTAMEGDLDLADFVFEGQEQVVIGRGSGCDLRLDAPTVSRRHCLLDADDEAVWVRDLESLNGTFVNGERVGGRLPNEQATLAQRPFRELHDGDQLHVGAHTFWVRLVDDSPENEAALPVERELFAARG